MNGLDEHRTHRLRHRLRTAGDGGAEKVEGMTEARKHPDIFTPDEAVEYLRLDSTRTLDWLEKHFHLRGHVIGSVKRFHKEDLDECALRAFGKYESGKQARGLKLAGGGR